MVFVLKYGKNRPKIKENVHNEIFLANGKENMYLTVANNSTPFLRFYRLLQM